jgi:hypothetical protein
MRRRKLRPKPKTGQVYQRVYKGKTYVMVVVDTGEGVAYKVGNKTFPTPTAAAKSIVGQGRFISGPWFWQMDSAK